MLLKLLYYILTIMYYTYSGNKFIWIDNGKNIKAINKKFIHYFFIWITRMIFN